MRLKISQLPIDINDPFLYHKTTYRAVYENVRNSVSGGDDVVLVNKNGEVTETLIGNVAILKDGKMLTPPVSCGLLAGTQRQFMLQNSQLEEASITVEQFINAEKVFRLNSIRGLEEAVVVGDFLPTGENNDKIS